MIGFSRRRVLAAAVALALPTARGGEGVRPVLAFRGIRYARASRFGPAAPLPLADPAPGAPRGPVAPQLGGGLAISMGPQAPNKQDEDCLVLSVFTPGRQGGRPVIVFLHGGGFATGGGELPWYDGHVLAGEQDVVVVTVTYRLGALGFWLAEDSDGISPAYTDILAALRWVQRNVSEFGGDPDNVTLVGQSAGCCAAMELTDMGFGGRLYRRVIAMSGGRIGAPREDAEARSRVFDAELGIDPRSASIDQIKAAYSRLPRRSPVIGDRRPFWLPVGAKQPLPPNVDVMVGCTREELSGHILLAEGKAPQAGADLTRFRIASEFMYVEAAAYARSAAGAGRNAYLYSFDWNGPDTGLGNCHCIDLAFLFGDWQAWHRAPMLQGVHADEFLRLGRLMRAQWAGFARTGHPDVSGGSQWLPVSALESPVTSLS